MAKNKEEVSYEGIYDNDKDMHRYQFMQNAESTQAMIDAAKANQIDPIVWVVHQTKKNRLYNNTLPIQRKVWDLATVILFRLHLQIMNANPDARLVRIKTDLLGYVNVTNEIETDDTTWGRVKQVFDPPRPGKALHDPATYVRTNKYKHNSKNWNIHKRIVLDEGDTQSILKKGG